MIGRSARLYIWVSFLSLAPSKLKLCSANHRAGYFSNLHYTFWTVFCVSTLARGCVPSTNRYQATVGHYADSTMVIPDSKVHGAYMGPTWGRQDPGGPHVDPMNRLAIGDIFTEQVYSVSAANNQSVCERGQQPVCGDYVQCSYICSYDGTITVTSFENYSVWNHQQLRWPFVQLLVQTYIKDNINSMWPSDAIWR